MPTYPCWWRQRRNTPRFKRLRPTFSGENGETVEVREARLIRASNPEPKDIAQTWGWKIITEHEKVYS
jgi:hypothetical protein